VDASHKFWLVSVVANGSFKMKNLNTLAIVLLAIGLGSLALGLVYSGYTATSYTQSSNWNSGYHNLGMMGQWQQSSQEAQVSTNNPVTLDQAKQIAQQYLASTGNQNLAMKEIMEFQNNFYIIYYEKDTGTGAFEMLIWKTAPSYGMMGGGMMGDGWAASPGTITPEPGPNMMWNTKYSPVSNGMMGFYSNRGGSSTMTVSADRAAQLAQAYLDSNFTNAKVEMATQFYGYYTFDFTVNGKIAGMLSVNGYTGQVWYHSWHGAFIQEVEFD
jgi:hypothetical protein